MSLIEMLRAFYEEMLSVEHQMRAGTLDAKGARESLERFLKHQRMQAEIESGQHGMEIFERATYAMTALADEYFLRDESPAKLTWTKPLEAAVFKSQEAGEKVFANIDALQTERRAEAEELARIYLAVLGLGFKGQFLEDPDAEQKLEPYRRRLYGLIFGRSPSAERTANEKMIGGAYLATLDDHPTTQLPYLRPWAIALIILFVLWIGAGHAIWRSSVAPIEKLIHKIDNAYQGTSS